MPTILQINIVVNYSSTGRIVEDLGQLAMSNAIFPRHCSMSSYEVQIILEILIK